jgi:hypothetical protein
MSGLATGYTLVLAEQTEVGATALDYIVTDGGVLFSTSDQGATWRCYGLVDPELFLLDLGFEKAWNLADALAAPSRSTLRRTLAV